MLLLLTNLMIYGLNPKPIDYEKIMTIGPNLTEIIFALEQEKKLIGCDNYSTYPKETEQIKKIGGIIDPNLEVIAVLKPQAIFVQGKNEAVESLCKSNKIDYYPVSLEKISGIKNGILFLSEKLNCEKKGEELVVQIEKSLEQQITLKQKKKVLFAFERFSNTTTITTINRNSFLSELIDHAGGVNIFADLKTPYPMVSMESIIERNPAIIIEVLPGKKLTAKEQSDYLKYWDHYPQIDAVKNNQIHIVTEDYVLIPGPRIGQTAKKLHTIFSSNPLRSMPKKP